MVSEASMEEEKLRKGPWHEEEDKLLVTYVTLLGDRKWDYVAKASGLKRSGKSCRLRWLNYLRPNIKHGYISTEEEQIILQLQGQWGNKWSRIARSLPGRTDNEIKNYWRTHLRKKIQAPGRGASPQFSSENFQFGRDNTEKDFFQNLADEKHKPADDIPGADSNSLAVPGFSSSAFTSTPYETRLLDWMLELSDDQSKTTGHEDSNTAVESCLCCWASISEATDTWDWSGSIWDMN